MVYHYHTNAHRCALKAQIATNVRWKRSRGSRRSQRMSFGLIVTLCVLIPVLIIAAVVGCCFLVWFCCREHRRNSEEFWKSFMEDCQNAVPPPEERDKYLPELYDVNDFHFEGPLVIEHPKLFIVVHDLTEMTPAESTDTDHVKFDTNLNLAYDIGMAVEKIIKDYRIAKADMPAMSSDTNPQTSHETKESTTHGTKRSTENTGHVESTNTDKPRDERTAIPDTFHPEIKPNALLKPNTATKKQSIPPAHFQNAKKNEEEGKFDEATSSLTITAAEIMETCEDEKAIPGTNKQTPLNNTEKKPSGHVHAIRKAGKKQKQHIMEPSDIHTSQEMHRTAQSMSDIHATHLNIPMAAVSNEQQAFTCAMVDQSLPFVEGESKNRKITN